MKDRKTYQLIFSDRVMGPWSKKEAISYLTSEGEKVGCSSCPETWRLTLDNLVNGKRRKTLDLIGLIGISVNGVPPVDEVIKSKETEKSISVDEFECFSSDEMEHTVRDVCTRIQTKLYARMGAGMLTGSIPKIYESPFAVPATDISKPSVYVRICVVKKENKKIYVGESHNQNYYKRTKNGYKFGQFGVPWELYGEWRFVNIIIPCNSPRDVQCLEQDLIKEFKSDNPEFGWNSPNR